jgi:hypothetical protein
MALSITEAYESGNGELGRNSENEYQGIVTGLPSDNADDVRTVVLFAIPHFASISISGNPLVAFRWRRIAPYTWLFTGNYRSEVENRQTGDASFTFTTGGGQQKITHALTRSGGGPSYQTGYAAGSGSAPDVQGGINCSSDKSKIEGVDIHIRTFDFKTTFYAATSKLTADYVQQLFELTACVNSQPVTVTVDGIDLTFDPGELLFMGAEGSKRIGFSDWELSLCWSALPNEMSIVIGQGSNAITVTQKNGWDYLWVLTDAQEDTGSNTLQQQPIAAYVAVVYKYDDLNPLLLGSAFGPTNSQSWFNGFTPTGPPGGGPPGLGL